MPENSKDNSKHRHMYETLWFHILCKNYSNKPKIQILFNTRTSFKTFLVFLLLYVQHKSASKLQTSELNS